MTRKRHSNGNYADKEDGSGAAANQPCKEVVLGDLIWVSLHGSSWWPAQVFDDNAVSQINKPRKRCTGEVLVRLYGSYKYMYVDPIKCRSEFDNILKQKNGNYNEIFERALEQDLARLRSGGGKTKKGSASQEPIERRRKIMQRLGLTALSGFPFHQNGHIDPDLSLCMIWKFWSCALSALLLSGGRRDRTLGKKPLTAVARRAATPNFGLQQESTLTLHFGGDDVALSGGVSFSLNGGYD